MNCKVLQPVVYFSLLLCFFSCASSSGIQQTVANISTVKYLDTYHIPYNFNFRGTTVGGLSGIDYDQKKDLYYLISDDRSEKNPARFYTANITIESNKIDTVIFTGVSYLLKPDGMVFPGIKTNRFNTPDPEGIRYEPVKKQLVWTSEGERIINASDTVLTNPAVTVMSRKGQYISEYLLPDNLTMRATETGPRRNGVLEGVSFADNYQTLYINAEEPLYQDGPRADIINKDVFIRIFKLNTGDKKCIAQYAYPLEPVAYEANPKTAFKINGVPEILSLGHNKLLVIERSFSSGRLPNTIRVFIADLSGATDISGLQIKDHPLFTPVKKTLLVNMDDLGIYTDNIEGVSFGPVLPNGHKTLLFIADNNFNGVQQSQVLLFELVE